MTAARRDLAVLAALGVLAVGVPLWLSAAAGTIGIPSGDDWVYARGASSLYRTGSIDMPGHNAAALVQLLLVQPLLWVSGGMPWAFTAFGLIMGLVGVASSYLLARQFVGVASASLAALLFFAFPGLIRETGTFVTDVPAAALGILCLLLGVRWLQQDRAPWALLASVAIGLLAVGIREFAIAAPLAVLATAWIRSRRDQRGLLAAATAVLVIGVILVVAAAGAIPGRSLAPAGTLSLPTLLAPAFLMLAASLLPATILAIGRRVASLDARHVLAGVGLVGAMMVIEPGAPFLWGQLAVAGGSPDSVLNGTREAVIPARAWAAEQQLALIAGVLAVALAVRWTQRRLTERNVRGLFDAGMRIGRSAEGLLVIFLALNAGELAAFGSLNGLFDRYLYSLVPVSAILILRRYGGAALSARSLAFATASLAWVMAIALLVAANTFAYDAARWRAGNEAVSMGYDPRTIDAGYEWVGSHGVGPQVAGAHDYGLTWYDDYWPSFRPCAVVANSPLDNDDLRLIRVDPAAYRAFLVFGSPAALYLYGALDPSCPPLPAATQ